MEQAQERIAFRAKASHTQQKRATYQRMWHTYVAPDFDNTINKTTQSINGSVNKKLGHAESCYEITDLMKKVGVKLTCNMD